MFTFKRNITIGIVILHTATYHGRRYHPRGRLLWGILLRILVIFVLFRFVILSSCLRLKTSRNCHTANNYSATVILPGKLRTPNLHVRLSNNNCACGLFKYVIRYRRAFRRFCFFVARSTCSVFLIILFRMFNVVSHHVIRNCTSVCFQVQYGGRNVQGNGKIVH